MLGPSEHASADEVIDLRGALVLPGVIDGHVHFDDPGFTEREDFATGTAAAAAGGVTMVVDMPCTSLPPVTSVEALEAKLAAITEKARVDFMLWGGVSGNVLARPGWQGHLEELVEAGVAAIKTYLLSGMETFTDLAPDQLGAVLEQTARLGIPVGVHAEDRQLVEEKLAAVRAQGADGPLAYAASRPADAEVRAISKLAEMCDATGAAVHIVHLGSAEGLEVIRAAQRRGAPMTAETCPHYLVFTDADLERLGSVLKTAPVVKSAEDRRGLWRGLADGSLLFVASDHAAGVWPEEKTTGSIWTDYGGVPGVELLLPTLYSKGVRQGRITLERLVEITAAAPARFFGVSHRKGALKAGHDADLVVLDEDADTRVAASGLHNKNRYTPLEGTVFEGRVRECWVRGRKVFWRNEFGTEHFAPRPAGRWIRREHSHA